MTGRLVAIGLALLLLLTVALAITVETARGTDRQELVAARAIHHEFGGGWLGGCFMAIARRETGGTFNAHAANWTDRHADGSRGSFGLLQIGSLWRRHGESVSAFAVRMYDPAANARLAHELFRTYGIRPWGAC